MTQRPVTPIPPATRAAHEAPRTAVAGAPEPRRRAARDPYGGVAEHELTDASPREAERPYVGEFEQRDGAPLDATRGEVRSRGTLRAALMARITAEPMLAGLGLEVEVGAQGVSLHGAVPDAAARQLLWQLLAEAGYGPVDASRRPKDHDASRAGCPSAGRSQSR